ncbi:MAG TPA: hypothetical protein DDZ80_19695 [Cyanobacteria bacterium UBA8803]|nr:hypothetical protein [Cyanobacteria bacterium UBA8803]
MLASQQTPPEDYLESSEKLLRSLAEPEVAVGSPKKRFTNKILTPLGIGSILLLLLSSATLTYIFTNPSSRSSLGLDRFFGSKSATTAKNQSANSSTTGNSNQNSPINGPNLASDEFTDVSLDTLTQLEASPSPSPVPSPVTALPNSPNYEATAPAPASVVPPPVLPESYVDLPRAILQPPLQPGAVPPEAAPKPIPSANNPSSKAAQKKPPATPAKTTPLKQSAASPAQTPAASSTSNAKSGEFYYVVTNYNGDRSLEQARTIVPDAYIRNLPQGTKIQLGAFKLQSEADTLIEQLRQQGISASVYSP